MKEKHSLKWLCHQKQASKTVVISTSKQEQVTLNVPFHLHSHQAKHSRANCELMSGCHHPMGRAETKQITSWDKWDSNKIEQQKEFSFTFYNFPTGEKDNSLISILIWCPISWLAISYISPNCFQGWVMANKWSSLEVICK